VLKQWSGNTESGSSSSGGMSAGSSSSSSSRKKPGASSKQQGNGDTAAAFDQGAVSMCGAVTASRQACRLPSLIGAAAVCYGLPAFVSAPSLH
jgi:hypothetical protein